MNRRMLWILIAAFALPAVVRFAWYFPGLTLPRSIATPDYASFKLPQAPVATPARIDARQAQGSVLVDAAHANEFSLNEVRSLTDALTQRGGAFVLNTKTLTLEEQLRAASAYLVISPSQPFTPEEVALVTSFVADGGRLAVFTDATRGVLSYDYYGNPIGNVPDVNNANPLVEPFGITVNPDYLYNLVENEGNFRNVFLNSSADSTLTSGVKRVAFYGTHSLSSEAASVLLSGAGQTFSSSTDAAPEGQPGKGWAGAMLNKDGNVLVLGDFSFLATPYDRVADNQVLIGNIADFLLGGARQPELADYPFLFRGKVVNVAAASDLQMTAEMTGKLSKLQAELLARGLQMKLVPAPPASGDRIVLGTYASDDELDAYVRPFGVEVDKYGAYVKLAPFGKMGQSGNGLLLYRTGMTGNTLVVLASDLDDMTSMLETLSSGDLSDCVIQGNLAACSIGFGGSFLETTPTPAATGTAPSG